MKNSNLKVRRGCLEQAKTLRNDLRREYPDLDSIKKEIKKAEEEGEDWIFDDTEMAGAQTEVEQINRQINEINEEIGNLKSDMRHMLEKERLDDLEGEIADLEEALRKIKVKRDRLALLKEIIVVAERLYREENQPDILQKAGNFLGLITDRRYSRLYVREDGGAGLLVKGNYENAGMEFPREVAPPLSRGTLEQIYLALRLALIEHLDRENEKLPLVLDEILVNWDGLRLNNGLRLLAEITQKRQVFIFTCHDWLVERLDDGRAQIISL